MYINTFVRNLQPLLASKDARRKHRIISHVKTRIYHSFRQCVTQTRSEIRKHKPKLGKLQNDKSGSHQNTCATIK